MPLTEHSYQALIIMMIVMMLLVIGFFHGHAHAGVYSVVTDKGEEVLALKALEESRKGKWLPVPVPVSNPTVGNGLALTLLYFHPQKE